MGTVFVGGGSGGNAAAATLERCGEGGDCRGEPGTGGEARETTMVGRRPLLHGRLFHGGTDSSKPSSSTGESARNCAAEVGHELKHKEAEQRNRISPWRPTSLLTTILLYRRTLTGRAMRAVAYNRVAASLVGIDADRITLLAFALAGSLGGLSGVLIGPVIQVSSTMGAIIGLKGFLVAIIAGIANARGVVIAGLLYVEQRPWAGKMRHRRTAHRGSSEAAAEWQEAVAAA